MELIGKGARSVAFRRGDTVILHKYATNKYIVEKKYNPILEFDKKIQRMEPDDAKHFVRLHNFKITRRPKRVRNGDYMIIMEYDYGGEPIEYIEDSAEFLRQMKIVTGAIIKAGRLPEDIHLDNILHKDNLYVVIDYEWYVPLDEDRAWRDFVSYFWWFRILKVCSNVTAVLKTGWTPESFILLDDSPFRKSHILKIAKQVHNATSVVSYGEDYYSVLFVVAAIINPVEIFKYISIVCDKDYTHTTPNIPICELDRWL